MAPFEMPMLRIASVFDSGSITRPLRITRSNEGCGVECTGENGTIVSKVKARMFRAKALIRKGEDVFNLRLRFIALFLDLRRAKQSRPARLGRHKSHRACSPSCIRDWE